MPRVADVLAIATRHADDDRRAELIRRAPAHRPAVVQLLVRGIGVFAELNLRDRNESRDRHAYRSTDDALLRQARVEHAARSELLLQPLGNEVHAALHTDVLAEHEQLRIPRELRAQRAL